MQTLKNCGYAPLPVYHEPGQSLADIPELYEKFPLIIISSERVREYNHAQQRTVPGLHNSSPEPLAEINPATATQYGLVDGTMVRIETQSGSMQMRLKINRKLATGVVSVPHGRADANVNNLIDGDVLGPITAYPDFNQLLCKVVPA